MKHKLLLVTILVVAALSLAACGTVAPAEPRSVSINGSGSVTLSPDMATVNIGVVAQAAEAQDATDESNATIAQITTALTELGVAESDIKTANFSIYPIQNYDENNQIDSVTYRVENTVTVTVNDLESLSDILDAVVNAGANTIYGIQFDLADRESAYAQAVEIAMQNAKERAQLMADAAGAQLGELQSASTYLSGGGGISVAYAQDSGLGGRAESSVPVSPGEMEINVEVTAVYKIQ